MLIDKIIKFCDEEYRGNDCSNCGTCGKEKFCNNDCTECLDDLHYHRNIIRSAYDCEHLLDFYVCRYTHKYCSEIIYALESLDLSRYPYFNILSLGCGGAPGLMAFDYMNYSQGIKYRGIDNNSYWEKIHNKIKTYSFDKDIEFYRDIDVLAYFKHATIENCNIIIIEYLISFFYEQIGESGVKEWFKQLAKQIVKYKPTDSPLLIIINDADSINTGRDSFLHFKRIIEAEGNIVSFQKKRCFLNPSHYVGASLYSSNKNKFDISSNFQKDYKVAVLCKSAQLILEVK